MHDNSRSTLPAAHSERAERQDRLSVWELADLQKDLILRYEEALYEMMLLLKQQR
jgi:hypothetical protein